MIDYQAKIDDIKLRRSKLQEDLLYFSALSRINYELYEKNAHKKIHFENYKSFNRILNRLIDRKYILSKRLKILTKKME